MDLTVNSVNSVAKVATKDMNQSMEYAKILMNVQQISTIARRALEKLTLFVKILMVHSIVTVNLEGN